MENACKIWGIYSINYLSFQKIKKLQETLQFKLQNLGKPVI